MNAITKRSPLSEFLDFQSMLSDPLEGFRIGLSDQDRWNPAVDISEDAKSFQISVDLPDVKKEDIDVSVDNGFLTISGERHHESEKENAEKTFHRIERRHGSYLRRFALPDHVDSDQIAAKFDNGVLEVTLPKRDRVETPSTKQVEIS